MLHAFLVEGLSGNSGRIKKILISTGWKWWNRINVRWKETLLIIPVEIEGGGQPLE